MFTSRFARALEAEARRRGVRVREVFMDEVLPYLHDLSPRAVGIRERKREAAAPVGLRLRPRKRSRLGRPALVAPVA